MLRNRKHRSNPIMLDAVVVNVKKIDTPNQTGDVDPEITPVMTTTIKREECEGKAEDIAEIIEKEAGIQVRQSSGLGSLPPVLKIAFDALLNGAYGSLQSTAAGK